MNDIDIGKGKYVTSSLRTSLFIITQGHGDHWVCQNTPQAYMGFQSVSGYRSHSGPGINGLREYLKWTNQKEGIVMFWINSITNNNLWWMGSSGNSLPEKIVNSYCKQAKGRLPSCDISH